MFVTALCNQLLNVELHMVLVNKCELQVKHGMSSLCSKTANRKKGREKIPTLEMTGEDVACAKGGKTCNLRKERENMRRVKGVGNM